ncbi:hypothetical protein EC991_003938 [Linnemannia zychae]|nr:hypothetical protein EC991_003938 [Linnemannia zychae]
MSTHSVTASYSVSAPLQDANSETTGTSGPILTFESPIDASYNASAAPNQQQKEQYLTALASALSALQESINTGLTERLVQQGILEDKGSNPVDIKNKVRTKVPGQPNNSKKGQTKKQQLREQQEHENKKGTLGEIASAPPMADLAHKPETTTTPEVKAMSLSSTSAADTETVSHMDVDRSPSSALETVPTGEVDLEEQYKPKGGIYGSDDEDEDAAAKDEVDLVMEADPGEIDGACLELPKEQDAAATISTIPSSQTKKRNEFPVEDAAATKKSRGSDA